MKMKQKRPSKRNAHVRFGVHMILFLILLVVSSPQGLSQSNTNKVLSIGGRGAYLNVGSSAWLQNSDGVTIEAWVFQTAEGILFFKSDGQNVTSQRTYEINIGATGGSGSIFTVNPVWAEVHSGAGQFAQTWIHLAFTYDSSQGNWRLYTNGVLAAATRLDVTGQSLIGQKVRQSTVPFTLGSSYSLYDSFTGLMDEVRVWTYARSSAEIQQDMHRRLTGAEPGLGAYWTFDDGGISDLTGHGNNGNLAGNAQVVNMTGTDVIHEPPFCGPHKAAATATVVNGFLVGATIMDGGCGYMNAPLVLIQGGGGSDATATATISNGIVVGINITSAGCCYTNAPLIVIASPPFVPTLSIRVSKVKVTQNVVLGRNYVLESSTDLANWTPVGAPFTATSESITVELDVDVTGRFFRIREVP